MEKPIVKLSRCPNGTKRNKITKICEPYSKKKVVKKQSLKKQSRCPNGTRRNKITKMCEPNLKKKSVKKTFSKKINSIFSKKINSIQSISNKSKSSYYPSINNKLFSVLKSKDKTNVIYNNILGCNSYHLLQDLTISNKGIPDINILNTNNECISAFSNEGQKILLNNLKLINKINCDNILVPNQVLSNCWFNCFFMSYFISDKGRRFFRFFRQLMILGKKIDNELIKPKKLRQAFMLLNIAIEHSYNYNKSYNFLELSLNTNSIIKLIYNSLKPHKVKYIRNINEGGNPVDYYTAIINYLNLNNIITINKFKYSNTFFNKPNIKYKFNKQPHLIVLEQHDYHVRKNITDILTINSIKYKLDSIIIRNTHRHHFICCFHCNNNEVIYDGASKIKLNNIKWKSFLNENKLWTLNYKNNNLKKIYYNFFKCYALYFYYRI